MNLLHTSHIPAGSGPFPTLIALHGWGASAHDLLGLAPWLAGGKALVLCPQGQVTLPLGGGVEGYGWFPLVPGQPPSEEVFDQARQALHTFVTEARDRYPMDPERTAVLGFSQGGVMAYDLVLRSPEEFSGLAALSSWLPEPLAEAVAPRPEHRELPTLLVHGIGDAVIDIERARESRETLRRFEVSLTYREFEMEHEIRPEALTLIGDWLIRRAFGQV
ncbi:MAG: alpha/beta hydrolase-fold protein [Acidobacteriota bacterium]